MWLKPEGKTRLLVGEKAWLFLCLATLVSICHGQFQRRVNQLDSPLGCSLVSARLPPYKLITRALRGNNMVQRKTVRLWLVVGALVGEPALAGQSLNTAIGGGAGSVAGAIIGEQVGGSTGALAGAAIGGAVGGAAMASRGDKNEAAIGGAVGGLSGAAIGRELGGYTGQVIGAGVGGATGSVLGSRSGSEDSRDGYSDWHRPRPHWHHDDRRRDWRRHDRGWHRGHSPHHKHR